MINLTSINRLKFYKLLNSEISIPEFETFIYNQPDLEQQLGKDVFLDLVSFNYKEKNINDVLIRFILKNIIQEGQFETWKLKRLLENFISDLRNIDKYLYELHISYRGYYIEDAPRKYEFTFLANLGLNDFCWMDERFMNNEQFEKHFEDIFFYHQQLKPFAVEILDALNDNKIQILNDGTYLIAPKLKEKYESGKIYILKNRN